MELRAARRLAGRGTGPGQFTRTLRGLATDGGGRLHAVGDSTVKVFTPDGEVATEWSTARPGECVAVDPSGRTWVGENEQVEVFSPEGEHQSTLSREGEGPGEIRAPADMLFLPDNTFGIVTRFPGRMTRTFSSCIQTIRIIGATRKSFFALRRCGNPSR